MTNEKREKFSRLQDRLKELSSLNDKIGRLAFYINNEKENGNSIDELMAIQLMYMMSYRAALEQRIDRGVY